MTLFKLPSLGHTLDSVKNKYLQAYIKWYTIFNLKAVTLSCLQILMLFNDCYNSSYH